MTDSFAPPFVTVPPPDAETFAKKYLEGCYTYYTAPEEGEESITSRMEAEDEAMTPMEVLLMLFPDVEPALLEAAFRSRRTPRTDRGAPPHRHVFLIA